MPPSFNDPRVLNLHSLDPHDHNHEASIRKHVRMMLWTSQMPAPVYERRRQPRFPFPNLIHIMPVDADGRPNPLAEIVVVGRHLSEMGLDFYYGQPISHRRVIASVEIGRSRCVGLLMDLAWCRFVSHRWYHQGGRFLQLLPLPAFSEQSEKNEPPA